MLPGRCSKRWTRKAPAFSPTPYVQFLTRQHLTRCNQCPSTDEKRSACKLQVCSLDSSHTCISTSSLSPLPNERFHELLDLNVRGCLRRSPPCSTLLRPLSTSLRLLLYWPTRPGWRYRSFLCVLSARQGSLNHILRFSKIFQYEDISCISDAELGHPIVQ